MIENNYNYIESIRCMNDDHNHLHIKKKSSDRIQQSNQIFYTTVDGNIYNIEEAIRKLASAVSGSTIALNVVSNVYEDDLGIVTFDGDVVALGLEYSQSGNTVYPTFNSVSSSSEFVDNIKSVILPDCVKTFHRSSYYRCINMTDLFIPATIEQFDSSAILAMPSLESIVVDPDNAKYDSRNNCNAVIESNTNTLLVGCSNTIIPADITNIDAVAFGMCTKLLFLNIPESVSSIGTEAFTYCILLQVFFWPSATTELNNYTFSYCSSLRQVTLPDTLIFIGKFVFAGCNSLSQLDFQGTMDQWNSIEKDDLWNDSSYLEKVVCSDGDIIL